MYAVYLSVATLAFTASLLAWISGKLPRHLKILSFVLGMTVLTEFVAKYKLDWTKFETRNAVYNIFMLLEFELFIFYYRLLINNKFIKAICLGLLLFLPVVWLASTYYGERDLNYWNSTFIVISFSIVIILSATFCYQLFISNALIKFSRNSEFCIAIAMLFFYLCNFPYLGMYQFIIEYHTDFAQSLKICLQVSGCLMYGIFTYAFLLKLWNLER